MSAYGRCPLAEVQLYTVGLSQEQTKFTSSNARASYTEHIFSMPLSLEFRQIFKEGLGEMVPIERKI